jgi:hypothetical protein
MRCDRSGSGQGPVKVSSEQDNEQSVRKILSSSTTGSFSRKAELHLVKYILWACKFEHNLRGEGKGERHVPYNVVHKIPMRFFSV